MRQFHGSFTVASYIEQGFYYPNMTADEIRDVYNGIGAEWMPDELRKKLDEHFHIFKDAVVIHDIDYARGLTKLDKAAADERFYRNCKACIYHQINIFMHPIKFFMLWGVAKAFYDAVREFGGKAFWEGKSKV